VIKYMWKFSISCMCVKFHTKKCWKGLNP
jgi:hypothetical protein